MAVEPGEALWQRTGVSDGVELCPLRKCRGETTSFLDYVSRWEVTARTGSGQRSKRADNSQRKLTMDTLAVFNLDLADVVDTAWAGHFEVPFGMIVLPLALL